ncbi:DUF2165 family protein [Serratia inhibens]|uniref:DUF2165 family protein n=1 Tax=Serratia inhibens TaxID=2338073 RepID=A0AA92X9G5_9GAMM|nr:DUF2165 family protein [Serratia inhibens]RJF58570.1 DUF2165 family protein [Serratia inhibens]
MNEIAASHLSCIVLSLFPALWGLGFMVIAGDWFMAWQARDNPPVSWLLSVLPLKKICP